MIIVQGLEFPPDLRVLEFVKDAAEEALANQALPAATTTTIEPDGSTSSSSGPQQLSGEALARQLLQRFQFPINRSATATPGRQAGGRAAVA